MEFHSSPASLPLTSANVLPFVGPNPDTSCIALLYDQDGGARLVQYPFATLSEAGEKKRADDSYFDYNPTHCSSCARPFVPHAQGSFTILFSCPHEDDADPVWANTAIEAVFPQPQPWEQNPEAPLGHVLVLRHVGNVGTRELPDRLTFSTPEGVDSLPFADVVPEDVDLINALIGQLSGYT
ncbi:hypothetical protein C8F01DRAFT_1081021 [Mycena amicta]|nr:hypothetical protein C8F01DRAFT_1081021 [Mycena amicta]